MYGVTKAWADGLRSFEDGTLVNLEGDNNQPIAKQFPAENTIGLPLANPPPPANHSLYTVNRFWSKFYHSIIIWSVVVGESNRMLSPYVSVLNI